MAPALLIAAFAEGGARNTTDAESPAVAAALLGKRLDAAFRLICTLPTLPAADLLGQADLDEIVAFRRPVAA